MGCFFTTGRHFDQNEKVIWGIRMIIFNTKISYFLKKFSPAGLKITPHPWAGITIPPGGDRVFLLPFQKCPLRFLVRNMKKCGYKISCSLILGVIEKRPILGGAEQDTPNPKIFTHFSQISNQIPKISVIFLQNHHPQYGPLFNNP